MSSTFSPNLAIELIGTFDQAGSWGNTTNTNLGTLIEQAISGYVTQAVATGTDTTITIPNGATGVARNMYLELTGTGGASTNLIVPANKKLYFIFNNTSSGQVTVKVSGQTGISVPNGKKMILVSNGTDIVTAENYVASLSSDNLSLTGTLAVGSTSTFTGAATFTANPTLSAGTANGVLYLNGSKVATSGSALAFNGTNLTLGTAGALLQMARLTDGSVTGSIGSRTSGNFSFYNSGGSSTEITVAANDIRFDIGASEKMRLTSSVLSTDSSISVGIGTASPAATLQLKASSGNTGLYIQDASGSPNVSFLDSAGTVQWQLYSTMGGAAGLDPLNLYNSSAGVVATFSNSGNLGLGVTPSAWRSLETALQYGGVGALSSYNSITTNFRNNCFINSSNEEKYIANGYALIYSQNKDTGVHAWLNAGSGTAGNTISFGDAKMTLDASGNLGIGTASPAYKVDASGQVRALESGTGSGDGGFVASTSGANGNAGVLFQTNGASRWNLTTAGTNGASLRVYNYAAASAFLTLDSSGNLGLGVTPSAWGSGRVALQIGGTPYIVGPNLDIGSNFYVDSGGYKYATTGVASRFDQNAGAHRWFTAPSGTAGNTISFTQAMTLDASGRLGVATTSPVAMADISYGDFQSAGAIRFGADIGANTTRTNSTRKFGALTVPHYTNAEENIAAVCVDSNSTYTALHLGGGSSSFNAPTEIQFYTQAAINTGGGTERARITADGILGVGVTTPTGALSDAAGAQLGPAGWIIANRAANPALFVNRKTDDGDLVQFYQADTQEGSISVSGNTVSYNAFAGSHWSQLQDGSKPDILRGTVMESINELCVWPGENNERLPKSKVSDTAGSKKVYGVFMTWDNDWTATNDMLITAVGAFICRVNVSVTVQEGDLLESNGDGTARVQADDIIRSSTIGKVTSTVKTHEYDDGSYCVPTVLYCG